MFIVHEEIDDDVQRKEYLHGMVIASLWTVVPDILLGEIRPQDEHPAPKPLWVEYSMEPKPLTDRPLRDECDWPCDEESTLRYRVSVVVREPNGPALRPDPQWNWQSGAPAPWGTLPTLLPRKGKLRSVVWPAAPGCVARGFSQPLGGARRWVQTHSNLPGLTQLEITPQRLHVQAWLFHGVGARCLELEVMEQSTFRPSQGESDGRGPAR